VVGVVVVVDVKVDVAVFETLVVESVEVEVFPEILEIEVFPTFPKILDVEVFAEILACVTVVSPEMLVLFKRMLEVIAVAVSEVEVVVCTNTVSETTFAAEKLANGVS